MTTLAIFVIGLMIVSEVTHTINDPKDNMGVAELIKYQPEWSHIHNCDSGC
jgi:hypothetical protein